MFDVNSPIWKSLDEDAQIRLLWTALQSASTIIEETGRDYLALVRELDEIRVEINHLRSDTGKTQAEINRLQNDLDKSSERLHREHRISFKLLLYLAETDYWGDDVVDVGKEIDALLARGQKIEAIKAMRGWAELGLKEAKDIVDARGAFLNQYRHQ